MFASRGITEHVARGLVGFGSLALAAVYPLLSLLLIPVALVALRGCPMCWTMGLVETVLAKATGRSTDGLCLDGTCARSAQNRPDQ